MSEAKFTQGPWKYGQSKYDDDAGKRTFVELPLTYKASHFGEGASIFGADGTEIAGNDEYQVFNKPEDIALMLAAPDMYEALETIERVAGIGMMEDDPARVKARDALRKARGEE